MTVNKNTWVVVRYPKTIRKGFTDIRHFHIYSKRNTNKTKMIEYYETVKNTHKENYHVHLVMLKQAEAMRKKWDDTYVKPYNTPRLALEDLDRAINRVYENRAGMLMKRD